MIYSSILSLCENYYYENYYYEDYYYEDYYYKNYYYEDYYYEDYYFSNLLDRSKLLNLLSPYINT